jgi:hypothetical protein
MSSAGFPWFSLSAALDSQPRYYRDTPANDTMAATSVHSGPAVSHRKRSVAEEPVTSVLPDGDVPYDPDHEFNADEEVLAALGYKSEFKREFSLFTTFCVSFAVLGLLPSFASTLYYGMGYAGTAGTDCCLTRCLAWILTMHYRYDMGLDRRDGWNPMRCLQHGRTLQLDANEWWTVLCGRGPCTSRLGSICSMGHWME